MMRIAQVAVAAAIVGSVSVLSAGCNTKPTVKPDGAAKSVVDVVSKKTGFHPDDVHCPDGVEAKVGAQFDCHFTGPEGKAYVANMKITKITGDTVDFDVNTHPS
jgi:deoxycytidylate deaminase